MTCIRCRFLEADSEFFFCDYYPDRPAIYNPANAGCENRNRREHLGFSQKSRHSQAQNLNFCFSYSTGERYPRVESLLSRL